MDQSWTGPGVFVSLLLVAALAVASFASGWSPRSLVAADVLGRAPAGTGEAETGSGW